VCECYLLVMLTNCRVSSLCEKRYLKVQVVNWRDNLVRENSGTWYLEIEIQQPDDLVASSVAGAVVTHAKVSVGKANKRA
jgi:hypothetical protein